MRFSRAMISLGMLLAAASVQGAPPNASMGVWKNPSGTVLVRAETCGKAMCGVVVWASDKAISDAKKGSKKALVGSTLFRNFIKTSNGAWRGKVYVPDIGKTFSGTITVLDTDRLEGKGCLIGGIGCRSQIWTRVKP